MSVLFELLDERDEVAVPADDDIRVDVAVRERHLEGIEGEIDVGAVLITARGEVALDQLGGVLRQGTAVVTRARPVAVSNLRNNLAALLERFEDDADIELAAEGALDAYLDIVEIDEYRNLQSCICQNLFNCLPRLGAALRDASTWLAVAVALAYRHKAILILWTQSG